MIETERDSVKMNQVEMQSLLNNADFDEDQAGGVKEGSREAWSSIPKSRSILDPSPLASLFHPAQNSSIRDGKFVDLDAQNQIDVLLSTLDRLEDEFDQQAYEELIPLNIRMALENQIFGWDHLYSATLGHVLLPLAAYAVTYWMTTLIGLKGVGCIPRYTWNCTIHKLYEYQDYKEDYEPILGMSLHSFVYLRLTLGLWSALSTFRTIRRRRKVWLHHQATEYFRNNTVAHLDMEKVDRETLLGRIRSRVTMKKNNYLNKRIMRKIRKAQGRFERRERRRREFYDGVAEYEGDHHRRVQFLSQRAKKRTEIDEDDSITSSPSYDFVLATPEDEMGNRENREDEETRHAEDFCATYQKYKHIGKEEHERDHAGDASSIHFYGHTMPAFAMQSIAQDQIRFRNGQIQNVAYAHGGFFGAAPFMLANPHWINILRQLMPDVYVEISRRVVNTPIPQLIHWAENNPVVAAYGTAHELEYFGKIPTLEWDIFLDPHLVQRLEVVLEARDSFLQGLAQKSKRIRTALSHKRPERRYTDKMDNIVALLKGEDERKILHFYNTEIEKRVMLLAEHILIAHGNLSQLALEQTGYLKQYNFSRVKRTRRTLGGGIYAKHWIMMYAEALKMSTVLDDDLSSDDEISPCHSKDRPICSTPNLLTTSPIKEVINREDEDVPLLSAPQHDCRGLNTEFNNVKVVGSKLIHRRRPNESNIQDCHEMAVSTPGRSHAPSRGLKPSTSFEDLALAAVTSSSISESMTILKKMTNCDAPLGIILDMKSRHVPKRVWALLLDTLRKMGIRVEGLATFFQEDIRDMSKFCAAPLKEILFLHSAGDLQKACHDNVIRRGDSVFFNAGSLFWNYPIVSEKDFFIKMIGNACTLRFDAEEHKKQYKFQPYARVRCPSLVRRKENKRFDTDVLEYQKMISNCETEENRLNFFPGRSSTIQQYKEHFNLSIGLYVQEFAIDEKSMDLLVKYVNKYSHVYDLGFSWGGINGVTVRGIQPGRFTNTDGFWNQRYGGERWDENLYPVMLQ